MQHVEVNFKEPKRYNSMMMFPTEGGLSIQMHHNDLVFEIIPEWPKNKTHDILESYVFIRVPSIEFQFEG